MGGGGCMCAQIGDINHVLSRDSFQKLLKKVQKALYRGYE